MLISGHFHQHFITCTNVKIHSFNVPLQGFCVNSNSLNVLLFVMNNISGSTYIGTVHIQCFDIAIILSVSNFNKFND